MAFCRHRQGIERATIGTFNPGFGEDLFQDRHTRIPPIRSGSFTLRDVGLPDLFPSHYGFHTIRLSSLQDE